MINPRYRWTTAVAIKALDGEPALARYLDSLGMSARDHHAVIAAARHARHESVHDGEDDLLAHWKARRERELLDAWSDPVFCDDPLNK
jgi:hypothetical protein